MQSPSADSSSENSIASKSPATAPPSQIQRLDGPKLSAKGESHTNDADSTAGLCSAKSSLEPRAAEDSKKKKGSEIHSSRPLSAGSANLGSPEMACCCVHVTFQTMNCLLDVLVTLSRIGAQFEYVSAKANSAILSVSAKPFVVRRIPSLLSQLIEVQEINEL